MHPTLREYLIHSYLYYKLDSPVISDAQFDKLCKDLLDSGVEDPLVSREDLAAGTGYSIKEYPEDIIAAANKLLEQESKQDVVDTYREIEPFAFKGGPMETYMLLGMYIDFGYARQRDRQKELRTELQRRWSAGWDVATFERYFKDHLVGPEKFKIGD